MKTRNLHNWNLSPKEAIVLQKNLSEKIILKNKFKNIRLIAGADMAIDEHRNLGVAGIIIYSYPDLKEIERCFAKAEIKFPYVPGLLAFREAPILTKAFTKLRYIPDVVIFDGQGIAHPRGLGIASHMGLILGRPTIGCAKSRLVGEHKEPGKNPGDWTPLNYKNKVIGAVLRTRKNVKPVFISPGHLIDLKTSIKIVVSCLDGVRIPKPTREADKFVAQIKREIT